MPADRSLPWTSLPSTLELFTSRIQLADVASPPAGRLKRGQDLGRRTVAPLITLPDSITPSQTSRPQTSKIHNLFTAHTQKSLQVLWEKQLDCQGQFAPTKNSGLRSHVSTTYTSLFSLFISKKKLVNLGTTLLRTLRTLQKARRSNSSSWQGSLNYWSLSYAGG